MKFLNKNYTIGIDIGGSNIKAILFSNGKILKNIKILTPKKSRAYFLEELEALIRKLISDMDDKKISGIGCGVAGVLDLKNGMVLRSPNLKILDGFNIKNWMQKKFNCDVKIDNDARCFTRAEYLFGSGRGHKNIVGITLGTGIGGGIIINGKIFYGANGSAGEFGHSILNIKSQNSNLKTEDLETLTVKKARKFSKIITQEFKKNLEIGFANIINILDPEIIIIGGGAGDMVKFFLPEIKKVMDNFIISPKSRKNVKIIIGKLGENAGAVGAAALFYE